MVDYYAKRPAICRPFCDFKSKLIVLDVKLEIGFWMVADWADFRGIFADDDMSAVAAFPDREVIADEDNAAFDFLDQSAITLFVMLLDRADHTEFRGDLEEAFALGDLGEMLIHIGPFVVLAIGGIEKILDGGWDSTAMEIFEPELGVLFLVLGGFHEDGSDLLVAFFLRFGGVIGVFVAGL